MQRNFKGIVTPRANAPGALSCRLDHTTEGPFSRIRALKQVWAFAWESYGTLLQSTQILNRFESRFFTYRNLG